MQGARRGPQGAPPAYESSKGSLRLFCENCGSQLVWQAADDTYVAITTPTLDQPEAVSPTKHIYCSTQLKWLHLEDQLPRFQGDPSDAQ